MNPAPRRAAGGARGSAAATASSSLCRAAALCAVVALAAAAAGLALTPATTLLRRPATTPEGEGGESVPETAGRAVGAPHEGAPATSNMRRDAPCGAKAAPELSLAAPPVPLELSPALPPLPLSVGGSGGGDDAANSDAGAGGAEPMPPPPAWQRGGGPRPPGGASAAGPGGFFARLRAYGFAPSVILDVGANEGAWARDAWAAFGAPPDASAPPPALFLFEGAAGRAPVLSATGFDFVIAVMGARTRWVDFFASDNPALHTGNSVLRENSRHFANVAPTRSVMRTLDELVATRPGAAEGVVLSLQLLPGPVLLKLDVQGYEIEVLRGAARTLASVDVLLLETSVLPYNKGSPLTIEVLSFLGGLGFEVLDMLELHHAGAPGQPANVLIQMDFAFVRRGGALQRKAAEAAGLTLT